MIQPNKERLGEYTLAMTESHMDTYVRMYDTNNAAPEQTKAALKWNSPRPEQEQPGDLTGYNTLRDGHATADA